MLNLRNSKLKWIWLKTPRDAINYYAYFIKSIDLKQHAKSAVLDITADSRYVLFINGKRIGRGPIRYWSQYHYYDTYDISPHLVKGKNEIKSMISILFTPLK